MAIKRVKINFRRPGARDVWTTKEGWIIQIRAMTDLHLLHVFAMLLEKGRRDVRHSEVQSDDSTLLEALAEDQSSLAFPAVLKELRYRDIIHKVPQTF